MNKKLLATAVVVALGFFGIQSNAIAEECPDRNHVNEQTNAKFLDEGLALSEEALEHAKQKHGEEAKEATKAAMLKFKCIVTNAGEAKLQGPKGKIKVGGIKAGKGDFEAAVKMIEQGIAALKKVDMTPRGLGD